MNRIGVGFVLLSLLACLGTAGAQQALDIADFVNEMKSCRPGSRQIAVAVTDFLDGAGSGALDPRERENVRAVMERALAVQGIRTTAMRDTPLLREWQREGGTKSEAALQEALRGTREVDAVIVFEVVRRDSDRLVWRARALSPNGDCSRPSADLNIPSVTDMDAYAIQGRFALIARQLFGANPRPQSVAIMPFDPATGPLGDCDSELPALLGSAIADEEAAAHNALSDRRIIRHIMARGEVGTSHDAIVRGTYETDERGRLWVSVHVTNRAGASIAQLPRTLVTGASCRGIAQSLIDHVHRTVRNKGGLTIVPPREPSVGTIVRYSIQNRTTRPLSLLCWSVAQDNTAEVWTPAHAPLRRLEPRESIAFPSDFGWQPFCFQQPIRELFGCFGFPGTLPAAARELWSKAWPEGRPNPQELSRDEVLRLLDVMRSIDGVVEAAEPYAIAPGRGEPSGFCAMPSTRR